MVTLELPGEKELDFTMEIPHQPACRDGTYFFDTGMWMGVSSEIDLDQDHMGIQSEVW